jgi:organic radical activating enzyme
MTETEIATEVSKYSSNLVVFTGGEPLLHELKPLIEKLGTQYSFDVETNGTINPSVYDKATINTWIVSPKLSNSGQQQYFLANFFKEHVETPNVYFKFVVGNKKDVKEVLEFIIKNNLYSSLNKFFLMPLCISSRQHKKILKMLFEVVKASPHIFKISPRLQVLAFENTRGV